MKKGLYYLAGIASLTVTSPSALATCSEIGDVTAAYTSAADKVTGGYQAPAGLNMWLTAVDESGKICLVHTKLPGAKAGNSAWLGSRVISAQKAFTANAFSLDGYAISTANLYTAVQGGFGGEGGSSLFGLQFSNPVDASAAYLGNPNKYGAGKKDPLVGKRIGGVNVFGGGLGLYKNGKKIGAIGVSGDTSCRDHAFAWQVRAALGMHPVENGANLPGGIGGGGAALGGTGLGTGITTYNIDKNGAVQAAGQVDFKNGKSKYGDEMILKASSPEHSSTPYWEQNWSHPTCPGSLKALSGVSAATKYNDVDVATTDNGILIQNEAAP